MAPVSDSISFARNKSAVTSLRDAALAELAASPLYFDIIIFSMKEASLFLQVSSTVESFNSSVE